MATTVLQVRMDEDLKNEASELFEKLGLDIPTAIRIKSVNRLPSIMLAARLLLLSVASPPLKISRNIVGAFLPVWTIRRNLRKQGCKKFKSYSQMTKAGQASRK